MMKVQAELDETKIVLVRIRNCYVTCVWKIVWTIKQALYHEDREWILYTRHLQPTKYVPSEDALNVNCFLQQHNTIESVLERGEKLDDLVDKSRELTLQSKTFYSTVICNEIFCVL